MTSKVLFGLTARLLATTVLALYAICGHPQTVFTVNSVGDQGDNNPGDGFCWTGDSYDTGGPVPIPICTLRAAIEEANASGGAIEIQFGTGLLALNGLDGQSSVISPQSALPKIESKISILGDTHLQWDSDTELPRVHIDGGGLGFSRDGLVVDGADGTLIQHVAVYDFTGNGIEIQNADEVELIGNRIGLASWSNLPSDTAFGNSQWGLSLRNANFSTLEGNWVGANDSGGIILRNNSANNLLVSNRVGLRRANAAGDQAIGNTDFGIRISSNAGSDNQIGRCTGLPQVCQGNIIVASSGSGIVLDGGGQTLVNNFIGVNPANPTADVFGNAASGIWVNSDDNEIISGLVTAESGNIIGHSGGIGLRLFASSTNNSIIGARVGIDRLGNDVGNTLSGIQIDGTTGSNSVGQSMIANNETGISIDSSSTSVSESEILANGLVGIEVLTAPVTIENNIVGGHTLAGIVVNSSSLGTAVTIRENHIGVRPDGAPIGNARGVLVTGGLALIGGANERGNVIGFNTFEGIVLDRSNQAAIRSNHIGVLPDGTAVGNHGPGILITSNVPGTSTNDVWVGYSPVEGVPPNHVPDGSGTGGLGNIIAHNNLGVLINSDEDNVELKGHSVRGNRIFANTGGGIQLGEEIGSVDAGGQADGPNTLLNHPQLDDGSTWWDSNDDRVNVRFRVPTDPAYAAYPLVIDFYLTDSGEAQGRFHLATTFYPASLAGQWQRVDFEPPGGLLSTNSRLVATATDADGNSSEFSINPANLGLQGEPAPNAVVITATSDEPNSFPDSVICNTGQPEPAPGVPHCTLRAAIQAANQFSEPVEIQFWSEIENNQGVTTIFPQSPLPTIEHTLAIAGETHPHFNPDNARPRIVIRNTDVDHSPPQAGLSILSADGAALRYLAITEAQSEAVNVSHSTNVTLEGNFLGLAVQGAEDIPLGNEANGIRLFNSTTTAIIGNRIAANALNGIDLESGVSGTLIINNEIGLRADGTGAMAPAGNQQHGVRIDALAGGGNQIGRCTFNPISCAGNVIVASAQNQIFIAGDGNSVQANHVGVNPDDPENADFGSNHHAIQIEGQNNLITSSVDPALGFNVIGHATPGHGILILGDAQGNFVSANRIGTDDQGRNLGNSGTGILIGGSDNQTIQGNIIGHNGQSGILILIGSDNVVTSNRVGVLKDGTAVGNNHRGIWITAGNVLTDSLNNIIGFAADETIPTGYAPEIEGPGNIIAYNGFSGVLIGGEEDSVLLGNAVRGNRIVANGDQSINLGPNGDTVDPGGFETGPNNLQNFPEFDEEFTYYDPEDDEFGYAFSVSTTTSNAAYPLLVDFYLSTSNSDHALHYLTTIEYTSEDATFPVAGILTPPDGLDLEGMYLIATATDSEGNTSQFSVPVQLSQRPDPIFKDRFQDEGNQ
jgi:CSLREA domain-containing protein